MRKQLKKAIALVLVSALSVMTSVPAFAGNIQDETNVADIFAEHVSESVTINNVKYNYEYYYNENGNKIMEVENEDNGIIQVVEFLENEYGDIIVYQDGEVVGYVTEAQNCPVGNLTSVQSSWVYMGYDCNTISWSENATVSTIAGLIAACCVGSSPAIVIASIGSGVLSVLAGTSFTCTVCLNSYYMYVPLGIQYMHVLGLTSGSGIYYGPFTIYTDPYPYM